MRCEATCQRVLITNCLPTAYRHPTLAWYSDRVPYCSPEYEESCRRTSYSTELEAKRLRSLVHPHALYFFIWAWLDKNISTQREIRALGVMMTLWRYWDERVLYWRGTKWVTMFLGLLHYSYSLRKKQRLMHSGKSLAGARAGNEA